MSPEERKAWGAKMKAARKAKSASRAVRPTPEPDEVSNPAYQELLRQVQELKSRLDKGQPMAPSTPQVSQAGNLVGVYEKYKVDGDFYPNPTERLAKEPRLQRFAFPLNYELDFKVTTTNYEHNGVRTKEPRFTLELRRIVMNEDTGEPTSGRYVVRRMMFHEDPEAAITIAQDNGIQVEAENERDFLNEMRYLQMRDWLLETFYPPKPDNIKNKKQMVIGNRLVEYFELTSDKSESIPFSELKQKL